MAGQTVWGYVLGGSLYRIVTWEKDGSVLVERMIVCANLPWPELTDQPPLQYRVKALPVGGGHTFFKLLTHERTSKPRAGSSAQLSVEQAMQAQPPAKPKKRGRSRKR